VVSVRALVPFASGCVYVVLFCATEVVMCPCVWVESVCVLLRLCVCVVTVWVVFGRFRCAAVLVLCVLFPLCVFRLFLL